MSDPDLLVALGIRAQDALAGLAGGIVNAFVFQRSNPVAIIGSVIVGALTANYLAEPATKYLGTSSSAGAFIVGLCAMAVCQSLVAAATKWTARATGDQK